MNWGDRDLAALEGTAVLDKLRGRVRQVDGQWVEPPARMDHHWKKVVRPFLIRHPDLGILPDQASRNLYRWATAVISAYSFTLGDDRLQAMVPYWDLLNHVTGGAPALLMSHTFHISDRSCMPCSLWDALAPDVVVCMREWACVCVCARLCVCVRVCLPVHVNVCGKPSVCFIGRHNDVFEVVLGPCLEKRYSKTETV